MKEKSICTTLVSGHLNILILFNDLFNNNFVSRTYQSQSVVSTGGDSKTAIICGAARFRGNTVSNIALCFI